MADHNEASSSNVPQDNVQPKPLRKAYVPPHIRRLQALPKFISVALFTQTEPLSDRIVLSKDDWGKETIFMNNTPRREIRSTDGRQVTYFRDLSKCIHHNGGIENWPPYNCYLFFDLLWGPSFGRPGKNVVSLKESISQLHTLLLGVRMGDKHSGFEIDDGRNTSMKYVQKDIRDWMKKDPLLRKSINRRGAVYDDVVNLLDHEYRTHGRRGYFTLENYVELLLHINESQSLEDLFSKVGCMPPKFHYRDLPLPQLLLMLKEAFGEDIYLTLVGEDDIHYLSSLGCRFFLTGEKIAHNKSSSVRGLLSGFTEKNVIVRIESIEWRWEEENRKLVSVKIIEEQKERKCEAIARIGSLGQLFKSKASIEQLRWQPPDVDFVKLNTCGISQANLAAAGGLLRDRNGRFISGFLDNLGKNSLDKAEIWALFEGLTLAWQLDFKKICIDISSIRVVALLTACEVHNPLFTLVEYCKELFSRDWTCSFTYAPLEANRAAHGLAEQGFWIKGFVRLSTLPREIETFLIEDSPGASAWLKEKPSLDKRSKVDLEEMALEKAKEIASANPVVVFSKTYCSFCGSVKKLFSGLGATFKTIELDNEDDGAEIQSALARLTGQWTVPNVFISGNHIGGCYSVTALDSEKKLVSMLTGAGALPPTKVSA